jgi:VWFA-related protein
VRVLSRSLGLVVAVLLGCVAPVAGQTPPPDQSGRIRVAVDVVPVDVQVIDKEGRPVPDLGPEKFTVTINGRRRKVVSAEQIGRDAPSATAPADNGPAAPVPSRVIMIAVDCISFDVTASREVINSIRQFLGRLNEDDYVGLSAYPNGRQIDPTTDHAAVVRALDTIVGQRDGPGLTQFHLRPTEIIDITRDLGLGGGPTVDRVILRECGDDPSEFCRYQLRAEVTNTALYYEGQATASLGMLRTLLKRMRTFPGRKTLILVSGGLIASDTPGGRPDLSGLGVQVGKEAAAANTAIYTLFLDTTLQDRYSAETRTGDRTADNRARDSAVLGQWLEQFSGAAGGALYDVKVGNADSALRRVQTELQSYYLLGVEPGDEDRDGRTHEISVKTTQRGVTIRGRRWVMIPKTGVVAAAPAPPPAPGPNAPTPPVVEAAPVRTVPGDVQALADAYDKEQDAAFTKALSDTRSLSNAIRGFRMSDSPWPEDPKHTAVFALEFGLAGLRSNNREARDEAGRLLAEYHARVRQPDGSDPFECSWFLAEASALEGLFMPEDALLFIPRAVQRCPTDARLHLAYAFVSEQQWLRGTTTDEQAGAIVARYQEAMRFPETEAEARVRAGRFLYGVGQFDRALEAITGGPPSSDQEMQYLGQLVRGQILRALNRPAEAETAFRAALEAWPGAQSARVALMTLLVSRGAREEAVSLAEAAQAASADQYDPWWTYWLGDYRSSPLIFERLRELAR